MENNIQDRVLQIIQFTNLSASGFADKLGVQRSNISHLLAGRNKPGIDFLEKLIINFPEINLEWLICGSGSMLKKESLQSKMDFEEKSSILQIQDSEPDPIYQKAQEKEPELAISSNAPSASNMQMPSMSKKKPVKVLILFQDGTFAEYNQE